MSHLHAHVCIYAIWYTHTLVKFHFSRIDTHLFEVQASNISINHSSKITKKWQNYVKDIKKEEMSSTKHPEK